MKRTLLLVCATSVCALACSEPQAIAGPNTLDISRATAYANPNLRSPICVSDQLAAKRLATGRWVIGDGHCAVGQTSIVHV